MDDRVQIAIIGKTSRLALSVAAAAVGLRTISVTLFSSRETAGLRQFLHEYRGSMGRLVIINAAWDTSPSANNLLLSENLAECVRRSAPSLFNVWHLGSYAAFNSEPDDYARQKYLIELAVTNGSLAGKVLRVPIVEIVDERFLSILAGLRDAARDGLFDPCLVEVVTLSTTELTDKLSSTNNLIADGRKLCTLGGNIKTIEHLLREHAISIDNFSGPSSLSDRRISYYSRLSSIDDPEVRALSNYYLKGLSIANL